MVFFGFWLSHVPAERFESFWLLVAGCLRPGGRVFFVDDAYRTPNELVYGEDSQVIRQTQELERRLRQLGWSIAVTQTAEPFYWGAGSRT